MPIAAHVFNSPLSSAWMGDGAPDDGRSTMTIDDGRSTMDDRAARTLTNFNAADHHFVFALDPGVRFNRCRAAAAGANAKA